MNQAQAKNVSRAAFNNKDSISTSKTCGCYACMKIFDANTVTKWVDQNKTALCPVCGIDAVISDKSGFLSKELLAEANEYFFNK